MPGTVFDMFLDIAKKYPAYALRLDDGAVAGFCLLRPYNPFPAFRETAEISYFIAKEHVGRGIGDEALHRLEDDAGRLGIKNILASIVSRNEESLRFHKKHGFQECGCFAGIGRKFGEIFDIIWMQKVI
jgi:phosphinothricin acetyltransferase